MWNALQFEFQPSSCWCCGRGFGKALCDACTALLPWPDEVCKTCGQVLPAEVLICGACLQDPPPFERLIVAQAYQWPWTVWVPEFKFKEHLARGHLLAKCLRTQVLKRQALLPEAIIPVPLYKDREQERGFNQAVVLARPLSRYFKRPMCTDVVIRKKQTQPQSQLKAAVRKKNLQGAFEVCQKIPYRHVAIVDDVVTTMSTVTALSLVLKQAGVERITIWGGCRA